MKFSTFSLVAVLLIQTSSAQQKPKSMSYFSEGGRKVIINNGVKSEYQYKTESFDKGSDKFVDSVNNDIMKAVLDKSKVASKCIKNSIQRHTSKNIVFIAKEAKILLNKVEKKAKSLILLAERKLNEAERKANTGIRNQKKNYAARSCIDRILKPIRKLHDQTHKTVKSSFPLISSLCVKLDSCARLNQRSHRLTSKCAREVKKKLKPIYALNGKYSILNHEVNKVRVERC